jgi:hypothetical protein
MTCLVCKTGEMKSGNTTFTPKGKGVLPQIP